MPDILGDLESLATTLDTLHLMPGNPRRGDVDAVARSLATFGQRKPIVVRRSDRMVIAGNHTLAAAKQLGWDRIAVVWTDDDDVAAKAYALADNRTAELGGYDDADLAALIGDVHDADHDLLDATGWTDADLESLLAKIGADEPQPDDDLDETPAVPVEPVSTLGDLWLLGPHRLLCGDATNPDNVDRVLGGATPGIVHTDPPYGISIVNESGKVGHAVGTPFGGKTKGSIGGSKPFGKTHGKVIETTKYLPVAGDATTDVARDAFALLMTTYPTAAHVWWGGNHYTASAGLPDSPCWLVWDKETGDNTFADAELAWTNHKGAVRVLRHMWNGLLRASERSKRVHPTQKPVALAEWAFSVVDKPGSRLAVLDVFGGSGSTLIAAERTGRIAHVIELEPAYVDVICRRYQGLTGVKPTCGGVPHDFMD